MTRTELSKTAHGGAHHTRLGPDWYLSSSSSLEKDSPPPVERRGFGRALMRVIKGVGGRLRAGPRSASADGPGSVIPRRLL